MSSNGKARHLCQTLRPAQFESLRQGFLPGPTNERDPILARLACCQCGLARIHLLRLHRAQAHLPAIRIGSFTGDRGSDRGASGGTFLCGPERIHVVDLGDSWAIRRGQVKDRVSPADLLQIETSAAVSPPRMTLDFVTPSVLVEWVSFSPAASRSQSIQAIRWWKNAGFALKKPAQEVRPNQLRSRGKNLDCCHRIQCLVAKPASARRRAWEHRRVLVSRLRGPSACDAG